MSRILLVVLFGLLLAAVSSAISTTAVKTTTSTTTTTLLAEGSVVQLLDVKTPEDDVSQTAIAEGGWNSVGELPYYDLKVSTNKEVYYPRETAKITITVINRGHLPDKDAILTIFIDDSPLYQEILQQADIGTTIINKTFYVGNMSSGSHTTKVEYNITQQVGSLTALTGFAVYPYQGDSLNALTGFVVYPYQLSIPAPNWIVIILSVIVILLVLEGIRKIRKHVG